MRKSNYSCLHKEYDRCIDKRPAVKYRKLTHLVCKQKKRGDLPKEVHCAAAISA